MPGVGELVVGQLTGDECDAFYNFLVEVQLLAGISDAFAGGRNRGFVVDGYGLGIRSKPAGDQNSFFHLRITIFVPRPGAESISNSSTSLFVPDRPSPSDFEVLKPPARTRFKSAIPGP